MFFYLIRLHYSARWLIVEKRKQKRKLVSNRRNNRNFSLLFINFRSCFGIFQLLSPPTTFALISFSFPSALQILIFCIIAFSPLSFLLGKNSTVVPLQQVNIFHFALDQPQFRPKKTETKEYEQSVQLGENK